MPNRAMDRRDCRRKFSFLLAPVHTRYITYIKMSAIARATSLRVSAALAPGSTVKVKTSVKVYHVGKFKDGLDLNGLTGKVIENVQTYQGKELSANLPWKVEFSVDGGDKPVKVLAHLEEDELETVGEAGGYLEELCDEDPSADECRVYDD